MILYHLGRIHGYGQDFHMFSRETLVESVEEGSHIRAQEEILHCSIAREPVVQKIITQT